MAVPVMPEKACQQGPEVVLQRDGGQRLVLLAHERVLFGLERLVQALG